MLKIYAVGYANKLVGTQIVYPQNGTCGLPSDPVFSSITNTTAIATWGAPIGSSDSYNWYLYRISGGDLIFAGSGNVVPEELDMTGLLKNTKYRLIICTVCGTDNSSSAFNDFTTTGPELNGLVELNGGADVTVTIRSLTNSREYGIDGDVGSRIIPYDKYEVIRFTAACEGATIDHALFSTFTLNAGNDTETIEISCP
jgi:hypothetical protein